MPLDLGDRATLTLSPGHYTRTVSGLPVGAICTVDETDQGGAVSRTLSPADGTVTLGAGSPSAVTIVNTFLLGSLSIDKEATATAGAALASTGVDPRALIAAAALLMMMGFGALIAVRLRRRTRREAR